MINYGETRSYGIHLHWITFFHKPLTYSYLISFSNHNKPLQRSELSSQLRITFVVIVMGLFSFWLLSSTHVFLLQARFLLDRNYHCILFRLNSLLPVNLLLISHPWPLSFADLFSVKSVLVLDWTCVALLLFLEI